MVTRHAPRHEQIAIRVWNPAMTTWWAVTDYDDLSLEGRADWEVTQGSFTLNEGHELAPLLRSSRHVPVPVTVEINGVHWDGMVQETETGQKEDGTRYLIVRLVSDHKHFGRMLARGPVVSAADSSQETMTGTIGDITHRLVSTGAERTGLPTYVLIDHAGDYVEVEVRTEDYIRDVLESPLAGSNSFVQVRKLLPGQPLPGIGTLHHYEGVMERAWESSQLAAGMWPNAATNRRIVGANAEQGAAALPDNSWSGQGQIAQDGTVLSRPTEGVCWQPFETVVDRPLGYYTEIDPRAVRVVDRRNVAKNDGAANGRPHYVTTFKPGSLNLTDAPKLADCVKRGLLRKPTGEKLTSVDSAISYASGGVSYAWREGAMWVLANRRDFDADNVKYAPRGDKQRQTPGVLVWQHGERDRRGVVFSSAPGGGLSAWSTTEIGPDGAMLIAGSQMDAQTIAALESGVLKPKGTVQAVDSSSASAVMPSSAGLPDAVQQLDLDVQPHATISGTEVSFSKAGGRVNIATAGPFFLREKYMNLSSTGGTNPLAEISREWARAQGTTSMTFTPGHHQTVVFGEDVRLDDGRIVPGWMPGDRVSFVDGETRVSEVIMGFSLRKSASSPLEVTPIMGRAVNGVMADLKKQLRDTAVTSRKALLAPARKLPKAAVEKVADDRFTTDAAEWRKSVEGDMTLARQYSEKSHEYSEKSHEHSQASLAHSEESLAHSEQSHVYSQESVAASELSQRYSKAASGYSDEAASYSRKASQASEQSHTYSQESQSHSLKSKSYSEASQAASSEASQHSAEASEASEQSRTYSLKSKSYSEASQAASSQASGHSSQARDYSDAANRYSLSAGGSAKDAEEYRRLAENARADAEDARDSAEQSRSAAEGERAKAELARSGAESARDDAEKKRAAAERSRSAAEGERMKAETARAAAEGARDRAEGARDDAEKKRAAAETSRRAAENARAGAEGARSKAESARDDAENERAAAEGQRAAAEEARDSAEGYRDSAETKRALAEIERQNAEAARNRSVEILEDTALIQGNAIFWQEVHRTRLYERYGTTGGTKSNELMDIVPSSDGRYLTLNFTGQWAGKVQVSARMANAWGENSRVDFFTYRAGPGHRSIVIKPEVDTYGVNRVHIQVEQWWPNRACQFVLIPGTGGKWQTPPQDPGVKSGIDTFRPGSILHGGVVLYWVRGVTYTASRDVLVAKDSSRTRVLYRAGSPLPAFAEELSGQKASVVFPVSGETRPVKFTEAL